jgi:hypothetical protein
VACLGDTVLHRLGYRKSLAERTRGKHLHLDASVAQERDALGECIGADLHQRTAAPARRHPPLVLLGERARGDQQTAGEHQPAGEKR